MRKSIINLSILVLILAIFLSPVIAEEMHHTGYKMDHAKHKGKMIREANVNGYGFIYHLIDMRKHVKEMKGMSATHHLMVYIKAPHGHNVEKAKVGYLVIGPDGKKDKAITMAMSGGFGADINLKGKGVYTIIAKALTKEKKLIDTFTYEVQ